MSAPPEPSTTLMHTGTSVVVASDDQVRLVTEQLGEHRDIFKFVWAEYLRWYTFLAGLNLIGLGFIHDRDFIEKTGSPDRIYVVAAFALFNVLFSLTSVGVLLYTRQTRQVWAVGKQFVAERSYSSSIPPEVVRIHALPFPMAYWAATANLIATIAFVAIWLRMMWVIWLRG
jgi:hypothetical protein